MVRVSVKVTQLSPPSVSGAQETVVEVDVRTVVHAVRTGRAGAQDVSGMLLNCSWTVSKLSR